MNSRRSLLAVLAAGSATSALAACGGGSGAEDSSGASDGASDSGAFPAEIDTAAGTVTVEAAPARVVALGWGDAETALALGVQPVGASDWLDFGGEGVGPWAEGLYDEPPTLIETLEPSYEAIAALQPDLILDVKSSGDQERHDRLSQIATTVGVPEGGENYLTTPDQQLQMIATALGAADAATALQREIDGHFVQAASAHPDWEGLTVTAATRTSEGWGAYIDGTERVEFLERLGFTPSPEIAELEASASGFSVDISAEQLDLLDADLLVAFPIFLETTEITEDPQWQQIPAVADGRAIVMDGDLSSAYSLGSVLATEYAVEKMVPLIEGALGA
ncbi:ABC transporter substrate-binding protein [Brachybacterium sacelli]|uniref:Iron complex transport system substrate-binding protein n=1 Tax=Brachybacterium sacelli TaxID=173364 RepID=A0ABS4X1E3_9MICO|nr:ABC transporter substrate-binding protein [Brachybacterium sacelli]MBP2382270.1 iron complex transport system substrate-binding protein [Brachybacterium sacelli]